MKPRGIYGLERKNTQEHSEEEKMIPTLIVRVAVKSEATQIRWVSAMFRIPLDLCLAILFMGLLLFSRKTEGL